MLPSPRTHSATDLWFPSIELLRNTIRWLQSSHVNRNKNKTNSQQSKSCFRFFCSFFRIYFHVSELCIPSVGWESSSSLDESEWNLLIQFASDSLTKWIRSLTLTPGRQILRSRSANWVAMHRQTVHCSVQSVIIAKARSCNAILGIMYKIYHIYEIYCETVRERCFA